MVNRNPLQIVDPREIGKSLKSVEGDRFRQTNLKVTGGLTGYVTASYKELVSVLGRPSAGDEYKMSTTWLLIDTKLFSRFVVYDYKQTVLYSRSMPSVRKFRALPVYDWHVRGCDPITLAAFAEFLSKKLGREVKTRPGH